jgi:uncharacterized protein (TIGR00266 family)
VKYEIQKGHAFALADVTMDAGEELTAVAGAMASMSPGLAVHTKSNGGLVKGLKRKVVGGETFFMNTFTATEPSEIALAPPMPGDIVHRQMDGRELHLTSGAFLASSTSVEIDTKWKGAKTFFTAEGLFMLKLTGRGDLFMCAYGAIKQLTLGKGEVHNVDSGHLVAFESPMGYKIRKFGGWKSTVVGGEGFVIELTGPGDVWMQTRSPNAFGHWLLPLLPSQKAEGVGEAVGVAAAADLVGALIR